MKEKIFILGASSEFGIDLLETLLKKKDCIIGLNCFSGKKKIEK